MSYLTNESIRVRDIPHEERPRCAHHCRYLLVGIGKTEIVWRCEYCLHYLEMPLPPDPNSPQPSLF